MFAAKTACGEDHAGHWEHWLCQDQVCTADVLTVQHVRAYREGWLIAASADAPP